jgi:hypothetical protein
LSPKPHDTAQRIPQKLSRWADKWTSVSPWQAASLIDTLPPSSGSGEDARVEAVLALFPRVIDPQDFVNIVLPLLDAAAARAYTRLLLS